MLDSRNLPDFLGRYIMACTVVYLCASVKIERVLKAAFCGYSGTFNLGGCASFSFYATRHTTTHTLVSEPTY